MDSNAVKIKELEAEIEKLKAEGGERGEAALDDGSKPVGEDKPIIRVSPTKRMQKGNHSHFDDGVVIWNQKPVLEIGLDGDVDLPKACLRMKKSSRPFGEIVSGDKIIDKENFFYEDLVPENLLDRDHIKRNASSDRSLFDVVDLEGFNPKVVLNGKVIKPVGTMKPEVYTVRAPFDAEIKKFKFSEASVEAFSYCQAKILVNDFSCRNTSGDGGVSAHVFWDQPPARVVWLGAGPYGSLFLVEMIGKMIMTPISNPLFLGSSSYDKKVSEWVGGLQSIMNERESKHVFPSKEGGDDSYEWRCCSNPDIQDIVRWTNCAPEGKPFLKIIRHDLVKNAFYFYRLCQVYNRMKEIYHVNLVKPKLWFGEMEMMVEMPFLPGRVSTPKDIKSIASELVELDTFLRNKRLIYTDWRLENILFVGKDWFLIDYDDMDVELDNGTWLKVGMENTLPSFLELYVK
eukprot:TRINITY_DN628_c0_g1_i1.p1 TRINITY_DN628_c0_g1~~TRINITY_DN628_c0_g1_i1.p1  ORF type:complete len:458 (-),score=118.11 TRINITY_DN628_c0_g1_i1:189-1562(-)